MPPRPRPPSRQGARLAQHAPQQIRGLVEEVGVEAAQVRARGRVGVDEGAQKDRDAEAVGEDCGQPLALRVSVVIRAHLRHAGSENELDARSGARLEPEAVLDRRAEPGGVEVAARGRS